MRLKEGDTVTIGHYSGLTPFMSVIIGAGDGKVRVRLTKSFALSNFLEGDPVVFGYQSEEDIFICGCIITEINAKESIIELLIDKVEEGQNLRQYERFPVSLYADVRIIDTRKKCSALVKDISYYGMMMFSNVALEINQRIEIDIYYGKKVIFLEAEVVRIAHKEKYIEYGLGIKYTNKTILESMKEYLERLKEEQIQELVKLKEEKE